MIEEKIKKEEKKEEKKESKKKKRGRRPKDMKYEYVLNKEQSKYFIDLSREDKSLSLVQDLLVKANDKSHGSEVLFKDLAMFAISKLGPKEVDKLQENSLSEMEKVERSLEEFNSKNGTKLSLGEYLLKKLNLN